MRVHDKQIVIARTRTLRVVIRDITTVRRERSVSRAGRPQFTQHADGAITSRNQREHVTVVPSERRKDHRTIPRPLIGAYVARRVDQYASSRPVRANDAQRGIPLFVPIDGDEAPIARQSSQRSVTVAAVATPQAEGTIVPREEIDNGGVAVLVQHARDISSVV